MTWLQFATRLASVLVHSTTSCRLDKCYEHLFDIIALVISMVITYMYIIIAICYASMKDSIAAECY